MAFDSIFQGPPSDVAAPGTAQSPSLGVDVVNKELYISAGEGWELIEASTVPSFAVNVMQPPYNATGDGITDDSAAIQAALNENAAIYLPVSESGQLTFYLGTTGLVLGNNPFTYNAIYGNGQILKYSGSGSAITGASTANDVFIKDVLTDTTGATGTPIVFDIQCPAVLEGTYEIATSLPNGSYTSLSITFSGVVINGFGGYGGIVTASDIDRVTIYGCDVDYIQSASNNTIISSSAFESANGSISSFSGAQTITSVSFVGPVEFNGGYTNLSRASFFSTVTLSSGAIVNGDALSAPFTFSGTNYGNLNIFNYGTLLQYVNGLQTNGLYNATSNAIPAASTLNAGLRTFVSDATVATFGVAYTSGGSTTAPVWSDGTTWYIG